MLEQDNNIVERKSRKWIWLVVILLIVVVGILIYYFVFYEKSDFSKEQEQELVLAAGEYSESGGRLANNLIKFFEESDLKTSMKVCSNEIVMEKTNCYRLLAIVKEENKNEICDGIINVEQKESCLMRFPFLM